MTWSEYRAQPDSFSVHREVCEGKSVTVTSDDGTEVYLYSGPPSDPDELFDAYSS